MVVDEQGQRRANGSVRMGGGEAVRTCPPTFRVRSEKERGV